VTVRSIPVADKLFATKIASDPAALLVLEAAGFRASFNSTDNAVDSNIAVSQVVSYDLTHNNAAILNLVAQVI
jgi:ribosomal protein L11